ncbi:CHASE2 domain-containing protein [Leptolyngbya sp. FACHB-17]|uniref:CHASE2 domain-containing protein n=1 Tax=unclassified Leptolyngbya TaxID=2650499 RepID=UPI001680D299|nr:CHASE2 domain-containing protein [Leptolyngbya sp. FACHB-17]MBD2083314.1 CHASE2 domain-containing protein [Leptolyngbya sp. FACHB-17]
MSKPFTRPLGFCRKVSTKLRRSAKIWLPASVIAGCVIGLRFTGALQSWELGSLDIFFRLRPLEAVDDRIVIVGIREEELQRYKWPLGDRTLARLLESIQSAKPRAVGLDIYRDVRVDDGHAELLTTFRAMPNLIGIQQMPDSSGRGVAPPPVLEELKQVGFNNVIYDADRKIRRSLLYWFDADKRKHRSFAMQLALLYLKQKGIQEEGAKLDRRQLQLGQAVFQRFQSSDGVYANADAGGYQILANFRGGAGRFRTVWMQDILEGKVPAEKLRDRIVLIGSFAPSLKDFSATSYSGSINRPPEDVAGVEIQANIISQILSETLDGRTQLKSWSEPIDAIWIWVWSIVGISVSWHLRLPQRNLIAVFVIGSGLFAICYGLFLAGWIVPLIPAGIVLSASTAAVIAAIAHSEEELKRSKEFLHSIIQSIPDPVFVKDQQHRWIVLNEAYSKLLGKPISEVIEKSDYEVFPEHEAEVFWQQDDLVFKHGNEIEHEEEFTNANGITYKIATKRSLHKDVAGNFFLVGVIRDITQRKTIEAQLRQTAEELSQSNAQLRLSQERLNYIANHDVLTGLPNRALLYDRISQALGIARSSHQILALMFIDLDGFKQINDRLGHPIGDLLLQAVAKRLTGCLRTSDTVARLGGDEFVVLLPTIPGVQDVAQVGRKILNTLSQAFAISGETLSVTASIGIALFPNHSDRLEALIELADKAMYEAKKTGKGRFAFADPLPVENSNVSDRD